MAAHDRTEKATPKRRAEARKKGQVARSADLSGAVVLLAALLGLSALGPNVASVLAGDLRTACELTATPEVVDHRGLGAVLTGQARSAGLAVAPIALICLAAGVISSAAQVGLKVTPSALKPDPRRINPLQGAKNLFGIRALFEGTKTVVKLAAVGAVAAFALLPQLDELAALVGTPPTALGPLLVHDVLGIVARAAMAYLVIGAIDFGWQRWRHERSLRMDKQQVREEQKEHQLPAEVRSALRRRQMQAARARMMADVPQADVVVTNPTHYAVALRYDPEKRAPQVVAKGADLIAARIREIASEHGVVVVPDPPLARSLHATVEVGQLIPEELYQAVAQLLAFVYRTASRRRAVA
jgi:flagellar biosynthetic protein FlhB